MARRQQFKTPDEGEATLKRAVELYHRNQAHEEAVLAAQSALSEMEIPAEYLDTAKKELDQEKIARKARQQAAFEEAINSAHPSPPKTISEAIARLIHSWGLVIGLVLLFGAFSAYGAIFGHDNSNSAPSQNFSAEVHNGAPQQWDLSSSRSDFLFDANPQTDADMVKIHEGGRTFERVHVRSFGKDTRLSNDATSATYRAKAYLNDQTVYFHGLGHMKFKARGKGLSSLAVVFTEQDGTANRFSEAFDLGPKWKEYTVDLNKLDWVDEQGHWQKDGHAPLQGGLYFYVGDSANDLKESGTVDFTDVELTN